MRPAGLLGAQRPAGGWPARVGGCHHPQLANLHAALGLAAPKGWPIKLPDAKIVALVGKATHREVCDRPLRTGTLGAPQDALIKLAKG